MQRKRWFDLDDPQASTPQVGIIGAPYDGSVSLRPGAAEAPARLRSLSRTSDAYTRRGHDIGRLTVRDFGDVNAQGVADESAPQEYLIDRIRKTLTGLPRETLPILIGGDNSVSIAGIDAFAARHGQNVGILWFDAHPDLFAAYDGNPLSHASALRTPLDKNGLDPTKVVLLATRSFAREEVEFIRQKDVKMVTAAEWHAHSNAEVHSAIRKRFAGVDAVYIAVDIDGFDAAAAPGTGYPMPGGVSTERVFDLFDHIYETCPVKAIDLTEIAPPLDIGDQTTMLGLQVILEALGHLFSSK
ncbi:MAG: arginase family protein [Myxococcota bacterium]